MEKANNLEQLSVHETRREKLFIILKKKLITLMASSDSSSLHSSSESYPERDSSTSEGKAAYPVIRPKVPITDDAPILVASERSFILCKDGLRAPDPCIDSFSIWQKQIFLPFTIDSRVFSFLGPILVPRKASSMKTFPSVPDHLPLIFGEKDVDASYFS
ncbi:hypothetical protein PIB30_036800 [Stylosanthes scabra]|uniref:Uncharacterized protein n=1 Tax=Stylosanthes scabra TaxID=79078 RepID=A0ABU6YE80_9FABA|nr:hypothetical protein [Stylosanthes scabra]